nr:hypothetical protein [Tanacetum cinerariifolium]
MPIICTACGGMVRGRLCLPCDLREKDLYNYEPNAYYFDNSNYFPQPQDENYLCNLCRNNSHDGYDCQQQLPFVYEQEPSYSQNYDDNYYPHESLSFPCCDYCGGSHETFQCQPDNQNVDFSGSDQIQTPKYPDVNPPSPEIRYEHPSITPETESNEVTESNAENLLPIPSEYEFDYLEEFSGALMPTSIADEECIRREHEEYISLMEKLLAINPFPRPLENFHANTIVETLPTSPIPIEYSDSQREEIDIFIGTNDLLPPSIENYDYDSEGEIYFLEELLVDDSIPIPEMSHLILIIRMIREVIVVVMNDIDELTEDKCFDLRGEINVFANVEDDDYFSLHICHSNFSTVSHLP